ncbi:NifU family protein [Granulicella mallensis]|jgi:Fe-S cluster biogenesis protein NfuA|uniref:Fe-S cluster biogenesis protein NfuA n=1 Tax=Granulicella mallensis TaxID=940614 RepID=A0A7W7ZMB9_9BACT|nr:NifU family protein [Granulicella mallensis]MBB5062589.1 Fe-S cluster biogenesis protein NfuA [Granulicella mallensis]
MAASAVVIESIGENQSASAVSPQPRKPNEFKVQTDRVEKLAARLEQANDPETRATALELVQSVIELHGAALQALIDRCIATEEGERLLNEALQDDLVSSMFLLHNLHPDDLETRVLRGIESVRPYLQEHGGDCELAGLDNGIVRLRLHGNCGSCPSSSLTLKNAVEEALFQAAPDIKEIIAENAAAKPATSNLVMIQ